MRVRLRVYACVHVRVRVYARVCVRVRVYVNVACWFAWVRARASNCPHAAATDKQQCARRGRPDRAKGTRS